MTPAAVLIAVVIMSMLSVTVSAAVLVRAWRCRPGPLYIPAHLEGKYLGSFNGVVAEDLGKSFYHERPRPPGRLPVKGLER